jgi:Fe-S-cluster-containing hydrogenase component 2
MKRLIIDKEKCKKDAICATECPISIISLAEDGFPEIVSEKETMCIACGHCVAVCPHGALSHDQVRLEDCPAIEKEWGINDKQAIQFLRSRRSIRFFKEEAPDKETIQAADRDRPLRPHGKQRAAGGVDGPKRSGRHQRDCWDYSGLASRKHREECNTGATLYACMSLLPGTWDTTRSSGRRPSSLWPRLPKRTLVG